MTQRGKVDRPTGSYHFTVEPLENGDLIVTEQYASGSYSMHLAAETVAAIKRTS